MVWNSYARAIQNRLGSAESAKYEKMQNKSDDEADIKIYRRSTKEKIRNNKKYIK